MDIPFQHTISLQAHYTDKNNQLVLCISISTQGERKKAISRVGKSCYRQQRKTRKIGQTNASTAPEKPD